MDQIEKSTISITREGILVADEDKIQQSQRHTEELEELINKNPSWIIRWGITLYFGVLLIVFAIAVLIKYPDTIRVPLKLQSTSNARSVYNNVPGNIFKVFVKKEQIVKKGQDLIQMHGLSYDNTFDTIKAPGDGKIAFSAIVQPGMYIEARQKIFQIHPLNEHFFAVVKIPQNSIGKVSEGQDVIIKLSNYPSEKNSPLKGRVNFIANEPSNDGYFLGKILINTKAEYNKTIPLSNWMVGEAQIITEDVSLLTRIYKGIIKGLNR